MVNKNVVLHISEYDVFYEAEGGKISTLGQSGRLEIKISILPQE